MEIKESMYLIYSALPSDLKVVLDCWRRKKYWEERKIIYIHVPKAAGTSISHALYGRSLGHIKAKDIARICPKTFENTYSFSLVRNPWDRVVSAYFFVKQGGTPVAGIKYADQYKQKEFDSFNTFLKEWLVHQDLKKLDYVFMPQHEFVCQNNMELIINNLGKVEHIDQFFRELSFKTGLDLPVLKLNISKREKNYRAYYDQDELIDIVGNLYAEDIKKFQYDF